MFRPHLSCYYSTQTSNLNKTTRRRPFLLYIYFLWWDSTCKLSLISNRKFILIGQSEWITPTSAWSQIQANTIAGTLISTSNDCGPLIFFCWLDHFRPDFFENHQEVKGSFRLDIKVPGMLSFWNTSKLQLFFLVGKKNYKKLSVALAYQMVQSTWSLTVTLYS